MDAPNPFNLAQIPPPGAPGARPFDQPPMPAYERRLHARAYQHWTSLRAGRGLPHISDLHPRALGDFALSSVLVELGRDARPPVIHFLGQAIAAEADLADETPAFDDVPRASLLGQLVRRLPTVRDRGAPVSFEADFPGRDGATTHYRGILLPFADDDGAIAYVYGVVSWKLVAEAIDVDVAAAIGAALALASPPAAPSPWAPRREPATERLSLAQRVAAARTWVALAAADRNRRAASLDAAVSAAHGIVIAADADPAGFASLVAEAALPPGSVIGRIVRLVFGADAPRAERARHAAVLAHARRLGIGPGMLLPLIERHPGGATALAAAERQARRAARADEGRVALAPPPALGRIMFAPVDADYLLLLARRGPRAIDPVTPASDRDGFAAMRAMRHLAAN